MQFVRNDFTCKQNFQKVEYFLLLLPKNIRQHKEGLTNEKTLLIHFFFFSELWLTSEPPKYLTSAATTA